MDIGTQNLPEGSFFKNTWGNLRNAIIGCGVAMLFGLVVLMMSIMSATGIGAQDVITTPSPTPMIAKVEYYLPYPGLLPDSPFYKVKMVRDWLRGFLTFNERDKAELELMYADKRIHAASVLLDGGKSGLAIATATKAEKYLESSVSKALDDLEAGEDSKSLLLTQTKAVAKHLEILDNMLQRVTADERTVLEKSRASTQVLAEKLFGIDFSK